MTAWVTPKIRARMDALEVVNKDYRASFAPLRIALRVNGYHSVNNTEINDAMIALSAINPSSTGAFNALRLSLGMPIQEIAGKIDARRGLTG